MKKFALVSLLVLSALALSACGGGTQKVQVATDATWPPFEMIDESTKEIVGFDIDLMKAVAEAGGFEVEFVNVSWDPLLAGVAQCQYDAAISAMTITAERAQTMGFSVPYFAAGQVVTVRTDEAAIASKDDLGGKIVGAQIGTTGAFEVEKISGATLKTYDTVDLAYQDLMNGQIDAVIADNPLAIGYVAQNADKLKTVGEVFTDEYYGIAVCKTNTELLDKINAGLGQVLETELVDQLTAKWLAAGG